MSCYNAYSVIPRECWPCVSTNQEELGIKSEGLNFNHTFEGKYKVLNQIEGTDWCQLQHIRDENSDMTEKMVTFTTRDFREGKILKEVDEVTSKIADR